LEESNTKRRAIRERFVRADWSRRADETDQIQQGAWKLRPQFKLPKNKMIRTIVLALALAFAPADEQPHTHEERAEEVHAIS